MGLLQCRAEWIIIARVKEVIVQIVHSALPFWCWAPTPERSRSWSFKRQSQWNLSDTKIPSSQWYFLIQKPLWWASHSKAHFPLRFHQLHVRLSDEGKSCHLHDPNILFYQSSAWHSSLCHRKCIIFLSWRLHIGWHWLLNLLDWYCSKRERANAVFSRGS